jgi:hypothetical protein
MPYTEKLDNLHGRPMVNVVSGGTFFIHDANATALPKPSGWLPLRTNDGRRDRSHPGELNRSSALPMVALARARQSAC